MLRIDMRMPDSCECGYATIDANWLKTVWPCPCYNEETQSCQAVIPHRSLYDPREGIDELTKQGRPVWCPLRECGED